jgi:hypothetical protein
VVPARILEALRLSSEALTRAKVRHVVVGGLAVCANGYPRATKDVDFLVGREAFVFHPSGLVTLHPEVPVRVNGIAIRIRRQESDEPFFEEVLAQPPGSILEAPPLVYMKLRAGRLRDRADVAELVKRGLDVTAARTFLATHAPDLVEPFEALVAQAIAEE